MQQYRIINEPPFNDLHIKKLNFLAPFIFKNKPFSVSYKSPYSTFKTNKLTSRPYHNLTKAIIKTLPERKKN